MASEPGKGKAAAEPATTATLSDISRAPRASQAILVRTSTSTWAVDRIVKLTSRWRLKLNEEISSTLTCLA